MVPLRLLVFNVGPVLATGRNGESDGKLEAQSMAFVGWMLCCFGKLYDGCSFFAVVSYPYRSERKLGDVVGIVVQLGLFGGGYFRAVLGSDGGQIRTKADDCPRGIYHLYYLCAYVFRY